MKQRDNNKRYIETLAIAGNAVSRRLNDRKDRIKPEPKPDVFLYIDIAPNSLHFVPNAEDANLRLTFDGLTGKLKAAEVLE